MKIDLTELFAEQAKLDEDIHQNHQVSYKTTRPRRIMALLVEIGELANATRCFKYWSNKPSEPLPRVLDEYADGMHFFLSLGIDIGETKKIFTYHKPDNTLTEQFLKVYHSIDAFSKKQDYNTYRKAFKAFLEIIPLLNVKSKDIIRAYYQKLGENYHRQETNY